jgi:hypothetical protein
MNVLLTAGVYGVFVSIDLFTLFFVSTSWRCCRCTC